MSAGRRLQFMRKKLGLVLLFSALLSSVAPVARETSVAAPRPNVLFISGRRPDAIRVWNLTSHFRQTAPDVISLPEHFKHHGYITQGIGKIYHDPAYADRVAALSGELKKGFMTFLTFMPLRSQNLLPDLPQPSSGQMAGVSNGTLLVAGGS